MMGILEALTALNQLGGVSEMAGDVKDAMAPMGQAYENMRMKIADQMGATNTVVDPGDASEIKVIDENQFGERMGNFADTAASMRPQMPQVQAPMMPQGQVMQMPMQQMTNPYAPVNYGTMQQQPMSGGIGSAPSMEQILRALQSQQR